MRWCVCARLCAASCALCRADVPLHFHSGETSRQICPCFCSPDYPFIFIHFLSCFSLLCLHFLSLSSPAVQPFITPFYPIKHTASWSACLFILNAYKPWTHALFLQQTLSHTHTHARTHKPHCPHHLVPDASQSVLVIPSGSPFHFASLHLSHNSLKIEGEQAWSERRNRVSLLELSLDLTHTHTNTQTQTHTKIFSSDPALKKACKS